MKLAVVLLISVIAGAVAESSFSRQLRIIGPADVKAAEAVKEAVVQKGLSFQKVAADVTKAKAHEAHVAYKADRKVAHAVAHAMKHHGGHIDKSLGAGHIAGGIAVAGAALGLESAHLSEHDHKRIAHAMAKAQRMKAHAKQHTVKVVVKSISEAAETNLHYGAKAAAAIGNAALNDAHTFAPILSGLAPQFLPQLASISSVGPSGLINVLGNLAQSIGGALLGNADIGVAGPDLLATRVASMIPNDLLSSLLEGPSGVGGGVAPAGVASTGLDNLIQNIPPQALETIVSFLLGQGGMHGGASNLSNTGAPAWQSLPVPRTPQVQEDHIHVPENALQAIMHSITNLMHGNQAPHETHGLFNLPKLPGGGLPLPLKVLSNLLGVLPHPDLSGILRMIPRPPLFNLVRGLPLGVQAE